MLWGCRFWRRTCSHGILAPIWCGCFHWSMHICMDQLKPFESSPSLVYGKQRSVLLSELTNLLNIPFIMNDRKILSLAVVQVLVCSMVKITKSLVPQHWFINDSCIGLHICLCPLYLKACLSFLRPSTQNQHDQQWCKTYFGNAKNNSSLAIDPHSVNFDKF